MTGYSSIDEFNFTSVSKFLESFQIFLKVLNEQQVHSSNIHLFSKIAKSYWLLLRYYIVLHTLQIVK